MLVKWLMRCDLRSLGGPNTAGGSLRYASHPAPFRPYDQLHIYNDESAVAVDTAITTPSHTTSTTSEARETFISSDGWPAFGKPHGSGPPDWSQYVTSSNTSEGHRLAHRDVSLTPAAAVDILQLVGEMQAGTAGGQPAWDSRWGLRLQHSGRSPHSSKKRID
jgi:hypothetical protein